ASEWCANPRSRGFATAGGSWGDISYQFGRYGNYPGLFSSDQIGFRCARSLPGDTSDQGNRPLPEEETIPVYHAPPESVFHTILAQYRYDATPLEAHVDAVDETADYRREKISFVGAGEKRAFAYLWLPKTGHPPYQVIHVVPSSAAFGGLSLQGHVDLFPLPFLRASRAVFVVALEGYTERPHP